MSARFEFATASRIIFGRGTLEQAGTEARARGRRALLITGRDPNRADPLLEELRAHRVTAATFSINGEPTTDDVRQGASLARKHGSEMVIGFGGGSAIDTAKAIAAAATNSGDLLKYLEVIGKALPLKRPALPCIAVPTTAGTGAEVTRNAVLASPEHRVKVSLRSTTMLPALALVDPALTDGLPPEVTAATGMDALTQLIEAFVCSRANPMTDGLCVEGLVRASGALRTVYRNGKDTEARDQMSLAALFSGLALANAGLGAVHGFAGPIGGLFGAPHGAVCAALLRSVMEFNLRALEKRAADSPALAKYDRLGKLLTGQARADRWDAVEWVGQLARDLGVRRLAALGVNRREFEGVVERAEVASSMKANPVKLTREELLEILDRSH